MTSSAAAPMVDHYPTQSVTLAALGSAKLAQIDLHWVLQTTIHFLAEVVEPLQVTH